MNRGAIVRRSSDRSRRRTASAASIEPLAPRPTLHPPGRGNRSRPGFLVILSGLPGSGKSRVSEELERLLGVAAIRLDELRERYFPLKRVGRELKYSREVTGILHALARELARSRLGSGETAILDGTFLRGPGRLEAARVAAERGDDVLFVKVTAPREVILARLACRRSGVDHASEAGPEVHDMMERRLATGEDGYSDLEIDLGQGRCPGSLLVVDTGARTVRIATANRLSSGVALGFVGLGYSLDPGGRRSQTPAGS